MDLRPTGLRYLACLWLVFLSFSASAQSDPPGARQGGGLKPFLLGGIQTHETDHQRWVAALHAAGMNAVQVTVYAHQGPWNTAKLWYEEQEPSVLDEIRTARRNGLQVVLVLRVALDHNEPENRFLWHGLIYPETQQATEDWFRIYTDFVVKWARIAEREGIEVVGVASEMNSLAATLPIGTLPALAEYYLDDASQERLRALVGRSEDQFDEELRVSMGAGDFESLDDFLVERNRAEREWARVYTFAGAEDRLAAMNRRRDLLDKRWRELVKKVRQFYSGRLTLAANFDNYHEVAFWDVFDFMGINAYFPLRETLDTPLSESGLAASWQKIFDAIETFKASHGLSLQVLFTELGYTRWRGVTVAPWSSKGFIPLWDPDGEVARDRAFFWAAQPIEPTERALALRALHRVWSEGHADLAGILYWKLSSLIDLQRFEPFMLYLGRRGADPSFPALTRFASRIRPLSPLLIGEDSEQLAVDAIVRDDLAALTPWVSPGVESSGHGQGQGTLLHSAVKLGRGDIVRHLLAMGTSPSVRDAAGFLPIHWACYQNDAQLVPLLLPAVGDSWLDARDETPLMKCARLDNAPVARRLLEVRPELMQTRNGLGQSALHLAADQGSVPLIELLMGAGGDVDAQDTAGLTPLHLAARRGEVDVMEALAKESKGGPNGEGNRPVAEAAIHGRREVFHLLFEGQQAREINIYGQSLLHLAAHGGDLEILGTLLEHFSTVDPVDKEGWTPLAFATRNGQTEAVALLLERGASIEHRNISGTSVLQLAGGSHEPRLLQMFVQREINVDLADKEGNTALHHSAGWGYAENIRILLAAGADANRHNLAGDTPLDVAERFQKHRAAGQLRAAKVARPSSIQPPGPAASGEASDVLKPPDPD